MTTTVYLNGSFVPIEEARVSVTDRGFLFGDGVYEVIPAYGGRLLRLPHHLRRLQDSLDGIRLGNPLSDHEWENIFNELLTRNRDRAGADNDQSIYLQVTRGTALKRDHSFPEQIEPTVYAAANPIPAPDPDIAIRGVAAVTLQDIRWQWCDIKAITLLANVLMRQQAVDQSAAEALLVRDGLVIEGSSSNVFVVNDGVIQTPPKSPLMLPGITRDLALELAALHNLPYRETDISEAALHDADEIWISSSTREIVPVTRLDGKPVGGGEPGPVWKTMARHYRAYKDDVRSGRAD
ncbi:MAG: D-amino acid aminotransferase [Thiogranum sp.]|nr:D-amino acid aminotransferase [Thiogranum sp.]